MTRPFPLKVMLPLALGVIVSIAVLVFSEFGYRRLDVANRQSTTALEMEARLNDVMQLVVDGVPPREAVHAAARREEPSSTLPPGRKPSSSRSDSRRR